MPYIVEVRKDWSYVVSSNGEPPPRGSGPWRYRWEAQEYADKLNGCSGDGQLAARAERNHKSDSLRDD
jgi:hypothetical protein